MTVIGIDTASRLGGVGIVSGGRLLGAEVLGVEEGHSQNVLPALQGLMKTLGLGPVDVSGIAVAVGPGSYTGLRIGVAVAKGLAYAWGVPVRGVSTLLATAWPLAGVRGVVCASLDARKEHVFCALYAGRRLGEPALPGVGGKGEAGPRIEEGVPVGSVAHEAVVAPEERRSVAEALHAVEEALSKGDDVYLVGDGAPLLHTRWLETRGESHGPARVVTVPLQGDGLRAAYVAHIGELELGLGVADDLFELSPNYLRRSEAERRWSQQSP